MKNSVIILIVTAVYFTAGCKEEKENPPTQPVSGSFMFDSAGDYTININAQEITAKITLIGGGGGGGGGAYHNNNVNNSTGGGGGGGAGEVVTVENMHLEANTTYSVTVGAGGEGGNMGSNGTTGKASLIALNKAIIKIANQGSEGRSNTAENINGGAGGAGYPFGSAGGKGEISMGITPSALPGAGGIGGNNGSTYGTGGNGGKGSEVNTGTTINALPGNKGANGMVQIEWKGKR